MEIVERRMRSYLHEFEKKVVVAGFLFGVIGRPDEEVVPLREGRLAKEVLGEFVGKIFDCEKVLAVNYYGLYKLSSGIYKTVESVADIFPDLRSIKSPVVHFNSIKAENVIELAPDLAPDYERFKRYIVSLRWRGGDKEKLFKRV